MTVKDDDVDLLTISAIEYYLHDIGLQVCIPVQVRPIDFGSDTKFRPRDCGLMRTTMISSEPVPITA